MCGIAGAVLEAPASGGAASRPGSAEVVALAERMTLAVQHRGPDGSGLWVSGGREVAFGHRRLAILDLTEAGAQPMVDAGSGCVITFNGEIYNFPEIREELLALGEELRSSSDTEVVLKAYRRWGIDVVKRFRGIFAFGLWDPRSRVVHLVRDPMGIKPLYWTAVRDEAAGGSVVLFASEVRALLASGVVSRRLDPVAVASFLWHGFVVGPTTIVEGVQLLPPATILTLDLGQEGRPPTSRRMRSYWQMPPSGGRTATVAELRDELARTVSMQLVSDVPLGVFLSGGIDSSAVAALASEVAPDAVHTFTIGFDVAAYDESRYAGQVAEAIRSRHTRVVLTEQAFQEQLPDALAAIDQPTFDGINTYFVSRAARQGGMTVALAGTGGDELFAGYPTFVDLPRGLRAGRWMPFAGEGALGKRGFDGAVGLAARLAGRLFWDVLEVAPPQVRWAKVADAVRVARDPLGLYQVFYALFTRDTQGVLAGEAVRAAQRGLRHGLLPEVAEAWRRRTAGSELLHAISSLELLSFTGERLLRDTDVASMAVALEARVPLLDHVLIETVAALDPLRRFRPLGRKQILRDVALGKLDPAMFDRPKAGFVLPIDTWARRRLQPRMGSVLADVELARRVGLDGRAVQTLWRSFSAGRPGLYWSRVWALYVLLSWCRRHDVFLDG